MKALSYLAASLDELERAGRRRRRPGPRDPAALWLCSNDYLGYLSDPAAPERLDPSDNTLPIGAGASRLIAGNHAEHEALEAEIARWLGQEDALVFSSGYAANVGLLSALISPSDQVLSDAYNHASTIDGCRLARAQVTVIPHRDVAAVERALQAPCAGRRWVLTEGYFSMDGDRPDLRALRALADQHGAALLVDDAHALGVFGPAGRGACAEQGVAPDALIGTFGKALGGQGAFVAGSRLLTDWLWNRARSFVFSTGLSPIVARSNRRAILRAEADEAGRARLLALSTRLREGLVALGYAVLPASVGPIVPVLIGPEREALRLSRALEAEGVIVTAIRPPTVPVGSSRLRVTLHAGLDDAAIERALGAFARARRALGSAE